MRQTSYIHAWEFGPNDAFTLSDPTKLTAKNSFEPCVKLRRQRRAVRLPGQGIAYFPQDDDLYVRTEAFAPGLKLTWDFIEVIGETPKDEDLGEPTSLAVRIHDGTDSRYWDGGAWAVAGSGDWNTETELNVNLSSYTGDSLAIEVRLMTTDQTLTPAVDGVRLRWTGKVESTIRGAIYDGVVKTLADGLRPLGRAAVPGEGSTTISFGTGTLDAHYVITDVVAVYDHDADPDHDTDLLDSYDSGTDTITLSSPIAAANKAWIIFEYAPTIAVTTSSDYQVGAQVPAIWITSITAGPRKTLGTKGPHVIDRTVDPPTGTVYPTPIPFRDLSLSFAVLTPTSVDLITLGEAIEGWFTTHPLIRLPALDLKMNLRPGTIPEWDTTTTDEDDTRLATGDFTLKNVPVFGDHAASAADGGEATIGPVDAGDPAHPGVGYGVRRFNLNFLTDEGGDETHTVTE